MNNFTEILRKHHLKATPQRLAIANALHVQGHITIESLYELMIRKFNSISLATIYKNINLMLENSFIQEVKIPHAKSVYELTKEHHSHLVCSTCREVEDVFLNIENAVEELRKSTSFQIASSDLVLSGTCKNCQKV